MKKTIVYRGTNLSLGEISRGERIETKVSRMMTNKEPITDGAPLLYEEELETMREGYDIRTDRWDVALMGKNSIQKAQLAKRDGVVTAQNESTEENNTTTEGAA